MKTAAVVPAYNEKGKIGRVMEKLGRNLVDLKITIDDGSNDGTDDEARRCGADVVLRHEKNKGVGASIRTGIDYAIKHGYDIVAILSGDDQHDPSELPLLLDPIKSGEFDFVQGSRWLKGGQTPNITVPRRILTKVYALLFNLAVRFPITDGTNGLRAFRTDIFKNKSINLWQDWLNTYELEPYLLYKAIACGLRVKEAPVTVRYHSKEIGSSKMVPFRDWWRILKPLIYLRVGIRK
ncbi:MAG: glycosyltransferase family 2 protein [Candidatus Eisenbacteria bacterium]|nr:glycosyltransferase family 2 protein [Candidatus Eisenbacteria bacterium]